jgi:hypothetical protein
MLGDDGDKKLRCCWYSPANTGAVRELADFAGSVAKVYMDLISKSDIS